MPEIPEVEIIRTALARDLSGKKVKAVELITRKVVKHHRTGPDFVDALTGRTVKSVSRLGTNVIFGLDNAKHWVINLAPQGELSRAKTARESKPKGLHLTVSFLQAGELRYADVVGLGEVYVSSPPGEDEVAELNKFARLAVSPDGLALRKAIPALAGVGLDIVEDQIGWDRFAAILRSRSTPVKDVLTDTKILAGIGSMYADEILFAAGLGPQRLSDDLSTIEIRRLHRSVTEILTEAIKQGGTTTTQFPFADPEGRPGGFQSQLQVAFRDGEPCLQCRTPIEKLTQRQKVTYFCPKCQS